MNDLLLGRVLGPGPDGWWDSERVSSPNVLRLPGGRWQIWYYGRDATFDRSVNLPTGRIGTAVSDDGIHWERVAGSGVMGSVLDPRDDPRWFDSAHVGVGDVVLDDGLLWMWYFGGDQAMVSSRGMQLKGLTMAIGAALSRDGVHWTRLDGPLRGALLARGEPGAFDQQFRAWPKVLRRPDGGWLMSYHTVDLASFTFRIGIATSDDGLRWEPRGQVLGPGEPGTFDDTGIATRQIIRHGAGYAMLYEANTAEKISIGLAWSDDGLTWRKDDQGRDPGGPVFATAPSGSGRWDARAVGCPCLVAMPDGGWRMYYIGANEGGHDELSASHQIGLAVSDGDLRTWRRWGDPT